MNRLLETTHHDALGEALPHRYGQAAQPGPASELTVALATSSRQPPADLSQRLFARVAASANDSANIINIRRPRLTAPQSGWPDGIQARNLRGQTWLLDLEAGARLPSKAAGTYEILVLEGNLLGANVELNRQGYLLCSADLPLQARTATRMYLRLHGKSDPFQATGDAKALTELNWQPLREGVDVAQLHAQNGAVTMFARFAPGARVPAHPHDIDEECLMVEGDLFLGDVLLPEGGFQFAPAGTRHGELTADMPCLLFFHGAVDAGAVDNSYRADRGWPAL